MNHDSKKFLYWSFVTVAYFIGWVSAIEFNFNGFITTLLIWALVGNTYRAYQLIFKILISDEFTI